MLITFLGAFVLLDMAYESGTVTLPSSIRQATRSFWFAILGAAILGNFAFALDAIGTASLTKFTCPAGGLGNGTCYKVTISNCPQISGNFIAAIKVNTPPNGSRPIGAVFFTTGGGGSAYYDNSSSFMGDPRCNSMSNCGLLAVQTVNDVGYETIQTNFSGPDNPSSEFAGWLTGPAAEGPRTLACRYATLVHAVWTNLLLGDVTRPICATGNSAGSSAIAYSLTQYGLGNPSGPGPVVSMVEASSGPVMGRIDRGCTSSPPDVMVTCPNGAIVSEGYPLTTALLFIDPAYDGDLETVPDSLDVCSSGIKGESTDPRFHFDSVVSTDFPAPSYQTFVKVIFGDKDLGSAVPQGLEWYRVIKSSKAKSCVSGATHELPGSFQGAIQIATDLTNSCKLR